MKDFTSEREAMVERQLRRRGIVEPEILDAFRSVPREEFVSPDLAHLAYGDHPLPIEASQTISQPYIVALMMQAAVVKAGETVLEVGAGSGYAAAVLSRVAERVIAIERQPELVEASRMRLHRLRFHNVKIVEGDGTKGWPPDAPYDAILASASGSHVPKAFIEQLKEGGRVVMPLGQPGSIQKLICAFKDNSQSVQQSDLGPVRFVPLIGEEGWKDG